MVSIKSTLLISSIVFLTACAAKFDSAEYSRMVDIRQDVLTAQQEHHCRDPQQARVTADRINKNAQWLMLYSAYIPSNSTTVTMLTEFKATTAGLAERYQSQPPSQIFCELKLKNIADQIDIIQRTTARRPR
jgi:hypothetical protein